MAGKIRNKGLEQLDVLENTLFYAHNKEHKNLRRIL